MSVPCFDLNPNWLSVVPKSGKMHDNFKVLDFYSCLNSKVNYLKAVVIDTPVDLEI